MLNFTLFTANVRGDKGNCVYPNRIEVTNREAFKEAMQYDHVCGAFRNNYRSNSNFLESNVIAMDCDNDHSDNPGSWVTPEEVAKAFGEVAFYVNYSRNHMKIKGSKSARPRFHIYFPIPTMTSGAEYNELKKRIQEHFPYFDAGALGEARFFFGTESPMVDIYEGTRNVASFISGTELINSQCEMRNAQLKEFASQTDLNDRGKPMRNAKCEMRNAQLKEFASQTDLNDRAELDTNIANCELRIANSDSSFTSFEEFDSRTEEIPEGSRNTTMSHIAAKIIKRYGNTEEAYSLFIEASEKCNPPLEESELNLIWHSATKFGKKIAQNSNYIPPEIYNSECSLKPDDYSDLGQAIVLAREYNNKLRYTTSTGFLAYNGSFWVESYPKAKWFSQELTSRQKEEVDTEISKLVDILNKNGALGITATMSPKKAMSKFTPEQAQCFNLYQKAVDYQNYLVKRRDNQKIEAALKEVIPMLDMEPEEFDKDAFALNCPCGTYDLRKGLDGLRPHNWEDFITKETIVNPGEKGKQLWQDALETFFLQDKDLIEYVQKIVGLAAIGKVYVEALIIAYGEGRNGKSTFWNSISRVLGRYSGILSTEAIMAGSNHNPRPELAECNGKRLVILSELEEDSKMSTASIKKLCSTDTISAEKKYKAPINFIPKHTLVLYTNHLPKVKALDEGTWRRLIVVPFNAKIEENADIKNYTEFLVDNAGEAIMSWIIEGAKKVIDVKFNIERPMVVKKAIGKYRKNNNWLNNFFEDCCVLDKDAVAQSGDFYNEYRAYCERMGDTPKSTTVFYSALERVGIEKFRNKNGRFLKGVRLKTEFDPFEVTGDD